MGEGGVRWVGIGGGLRWREGRGVGGREDRWTGRQRGEAVRGSSGWERTTCTVLLPEVDAKVGACVCRSSRRRW